MRIRWAAVLAVAASLAEGCGSSGGTGTGMTSALPLSGNWEVYLSAVPVGSTGLPLLTAGSLLMNGNNVSADFLPAEVPACTVVNSAAMALTGTVSQSSISLTSTAWGGTVFTVTGTVSSDGQTISANWSGKGGCADGQSGSFNLQYIPPVTGTWTGVLGALPTLGTLQPPPPGGLAGATINFQLQQGATPVQFSFQLSGTVSVSGSTCGFTTGTLIQIDPIVPLEPSSITGPFWSAEATMNDGSEMLATGVRGATGEWSVIVEAMGGTCDGAEAESTLTGP